MTEYQHEIRMQLLRMILGTLGNDFVTEDVIRDVLKFEEKLFSL